MRPVLSPAGALLKRVWILPGPGQGYGLSVCLRYPTLVLARSAQGVCVVGML